MNLLSEMKKSGCYPDIITVNLLIDVLYKFNRSYEAWKMFNQLKSMNLSPTTATYNTLLAGLSREGEVDKAMELFRVMDTRGCIPNMITYNTVLDCFCKNGRVDLALNMIAEMSEKDFKPDVLTYNTIIHGLVKEGRPADAFWLFNQMRKVLIPDFTTLCSLLPGVIRNGQVKYALSITMHFCLKNEIDRSSWIYLMQGILRVAGIDGSIQFSKIVVANGIVKDDCLLCPLIVYLCKSDQVADAYNLFEDFKKHGMLPTLGTYNPLISGLLEANLSSLAFMLLKEMRKI